MSPTTSPVRWTTQDIEALPDNEWVRYEIVDGELFVTRSPHHKHQQLAGRIFAAQDAITSPLLPGFACAVAPLFGIRRP
jgi:Uma2 family endonuclease